VKKLLLLSLGSNLGKREVFLSQAEHQLVQFIGPVNLRSSIRETEPQGVSGHPRYLNQVLVFQSNLDAFAILKACQQIEASLGRLGKGLLQPRTIDIDLLDYGNEVIDSKELILPHPSLHLRDFVLLPIREILPGWKHPLKNLTAQEMLSEL
jgi:2-amino-4-hydroxy-6-hydroxymethyldihydropteridine diphosphokinase